jgi:alkylhydroperoxidase family enzyme
VSTPRVAPGRRADIGRLNALIVGALGLVNGGAPPNVFRTLALHRGLFRPWLRFAGRLMPGGRLPRADSELLILRTAHNCASEYEWTQHERLGRLAGLSDDEIARVLLGANAEGWSARQAAMLAACDMLHASRDLDTPTWDALRAHLDEIDCLELCLLVGHYEMLAMTLNALRVESDAPAGPPPRIVAAIQRRIANR